MLEEVVNMLEEEDMVNMLVEVEVNMLAEPDVLPGSPILEAHFCNNKKCRIHRRSILRLKFWNEKYYFVDLTLKGMKYS